MSRIEKNFRVVKDKECRKPIAPITKSEMTPFELLLRQKFAETRDSDREEKEKNRQKLRKR